MSMCEAIEATRLRMPVLRDPYSTRVDAQFSTYQKRPRCEWQTDNWRLNELPRSNEVLSPQSYQSGHQDGHIKLRCPCHSTQCRRLLRKRRKTENSQRGHIFADGPSGAVWSPPQRASCALQHQPRRSRPWSPDNRKVRRTFYIAVFREILSSAPVRPQKFPQIVRCVARPNKEDTDAETMSQIFLQRSTMSAGEENKKQKMCWCCM